MTSLGKLLNLSCIKPDAGGAYSLCLLSCIVSVVILTIYIQQLYPCLTLENIKTQGYFSTCNQSTKYRLHLAVIFRFSHYPHLSNRTSFICTCLMLLEVGCFWYWWMKSINYSSIFMLVTVKPVGACALRAPLDGTWGRCLCFRKGS